MNTLQFHDWDLLIPHKPTDFPEYSMPPRQSTVQTLVGRLLQKESE